MRHAQAPDGHQVRLPAYSVDCARWCIVLHVVRHVHTNLLRPNGRLLSDVARLFGVCSSTHCQVTNVHARWFIVRLAVVLLIGIVVVEVSTNLAARTSAILTLYVPSVCTLVRGGTIEISSGGASVSILGV